MLDELFSLVKKPLTIIAVAAGIIVFTVVSGFDGLLVSVVAAAIILIVVATRRHRKKAETASPKSELTVLREKWVVRGEKQKIYGPMYEQARNLQEQYEEQYAILSNLNEFFTPRMDECISLCWKSINLAEAIREADIDMYGVAMNNVSPFYRLSIIYEKRKEFEAAMKVCAMAIRLGFTKDGSKGGMRGRLARLMRKAGHVQMSEEYVALSSGQDNDAIN